MTVILAVLTVLSVLFGGLFICACIVGGRADRRVMLPEPPLLLPAPMTPLLLPAP